MLFCLSCSRVLEQESWEWRCPGCHAALEYRADAKPFPDDLSGRSYDMWRYSEALPAKAVQAPVSLGEGLTPVVRVDWRGIDVDFKLDFLNPSGSFKDRGSAMLISMLAADGVRAILNDSSGNAGSSMAAYAAYSGIECTIFTPAHASPAKLAQIEVYGANLVRVEGARQQAADACHEAIGDGRVYASHNWNPFFLEGTKTLAYELYEQYDGRLPEWLIVPAGYGSMALGAYRGFKDLVAFGKLNRMPKLGLVQAANCAPLVEAFQGDLDGPPKGWEPPYGGRTVAEGIAASKPIRGRELLEAVEKSRGLLLSVEEDDITDARKELAAKGIYVEPTSAVVPAAISKLRSEGTLGPGGSVIGVLTGTGLKAT